jgi:hypothetical protein
MLWNSNVDLCSEALISASVLDFLIFMDIWLLMDYHCTGLVVENRNICLSCQRKLGSAKKAMR